MPTSISKRTSKPSPGRVPAGTALLQVLAALGLALVLLALLLLDVAADRLTANPVQEIEQQTGKAAYLLLLLSLAVTPMARLLLGARLVSADWDPEALAPLRRVLGWTALLWATGHFLVFIGLDFGFDPGLIWGAVADKRFALVGLLAWLLLLGRALASPEGRWLGGLRLAAPLFTPLAAALAALHYLWAVKTITAKETLYAVVTALLLGFWLVLRFRLRP